jgi:Family of unknown function (DUF6941)
MKIALLLNADYANVTKDGKLNVMGIFNSIHAPKFPARHSSIYLIMKLLPELGEYGQNRTLNVHLRDPDGKEIIHLSGPVQIPSPEGGKKPEVNTIFEFRDIIFPKEGHYQFVVLVDKDYKGDLSLYVEKIDILALKTN